MRGWIEYAAYRALAFAVPLLPRRAMVWLGRRLGGLYFLAHAKGRRVGLENLQRVFPDRDDHRRILRESMRLQGVALLDALWSAGLSAEKGKHYVDFAVLEKVRVLEKLAEGKGAVMGTAHYGSWEMFNLAAGAIGLPRATVIARPVRNARIDAHLVQRRERTGNQIVYRNKAVPACMAALRRGEFACSVIDIAVLPAEGAVFVDFLGTRAATSAALPLLAVRRQAPLFFAVLRPLEGGYRYRLDGHEIPVDRDAPRDAEILRLTQEMSDALAEHVRACPEAWFWSYKRWKWRPSELPGTYPSYALWIEPLW